MDKEKNYVYGLSGIMQLFGCSRMTACRIKASGKLDNAMYQIGRKIIIDVDKAMEIASLSKSKK
ncbi:hypothetical protein SDC9_49573 [bioreactor metagenome]|uniref:DUF3853 family protein n=1 Tax=bioreactor metagenome TaxID=1076179 RepID=A0A644WII0_9ZZZZ